MKGYSGSTTLSASSERCGCYSINKTGNNIALKHARKHEARPHRVKEKKEKSSVLIQTISVLFVLEEATWAVVKINA